MRTADWSNRGRANRSINGLDWRSREMLVGYLQREIWTRGYAGKQALTLVSDSRANQRAMKPCDRRVGQLQMLPAASRGLLGVTLRND